jgi:hypothetical protein
MTAGPLKPSKQGQQRSSACQTALMGMTDTVHHKQWFAYQSPMAPKNPDIET